MDKVSDWDKDDLDVGKKNEELVNMPNTKATASNYE